MNAQDANSFFSQLKACRDCIAQYPTTNPAVSHQLAMFLASLRVLHDEVGAVTIAFERDAIRINGWTCPAWVTATPQALWLVNLCRERHIETLVFEAELNTRELLKFIEILDHDPAGFPDAESASLMLFRQQVRYLIVNPSTMDHTFSNLPVGGNENSLRFPASGETAGGSPQAMVAAQGSPLPGQTSALVLDPEIEANVLAPRGPRDRIQSMARVPRERPLRPVPQKPARSAVSQIPLTESPGGLPALPLASVPAATVPSAAAVGIPSPPVAEGREHWSAFEPETDPLFLKVKLFISREDFNSILQTMLRFMDERKLHKVAETLSMIRKDLTSESYQERSIAFSSYHVVVISLIQRRQDKPLFSILKSLIVDLHDCTEQELYTIHLDTLMKMLEHFYETNQAAPLIYGLDILASQNLVRGAEISKLIEEKLQTFLRGPVLELLFDDHNMVLKPYRDSLFKKHGLGIIDPLLKDLYLSEDRKQRKILLALLRDMGNQILPNLTAELKRAIDNEEPWYVKRNLLTLFLDNPPANLVYMLETLMRDTHPRLLEVVYRCLFHIEEEEALSLGRKVLRTATSKSLPNLLNILVEARRQNYAPILAERFEEETDTETKLLLLETIGKLDSEETIDFLDQLLSKKTLFGNKTLPQYRLCAVNALAQSTHTQALGYLTKYVRDRDPAVRGVVRQAMDR